MDDYSILRLKQHLMNSNTSDKSHIQTDFKNFVQNYKTDFDFYFQEYLKYRKFVDVTLINYLDTCEKNRNKY